MVFYKQSSIIFLLIVLLFLLGIILVIPLFSIKAGEVNTSVTVYTQYNLSQNNFRFYAPTNTYRPSDVWPPGTYDLPINSNLTLASFPIHQGDILRLRISLTANNSIQVNKVRFKLQFKSRGAGCSANETWHDFGDSGSTAAWRGFDIYGLNDDTQLSGLMLPDSDINGYYNEFGTTPWNSQIIPAGNDIEYEWVIQNNAASYGGTGYCFRVVQADNSNNTVVLPAYNRYIEIETICQYTETVSNTINYTDGGSSTLTSPDNTQFFIQAPANYATASMDFKMYSFPKNDIMSTINKPTGFQPVGSYMYQAQCEKDNIFQSTFIQPITIKISYNDSDVSGYDESKLVIKRWDGNEWISLPSSVDTVNNTVIATTSAFSYFGVFGEEEEEEEPSCGDGSCNGSETCSSCPSDCGVCPSGGGGGGGGGALVPQVTTKVIIQGRASPAAYLTVLKDGQLLTHTQADNQADFKVEISDITAGLYTFGILSEDKNGVKSIAFNFTVNIVLGATTTVEGIFIPPTISLKKDSVRQGEDLNISGQTAPRSQVEIYINPGKIIRRITADNTGVWAYNLDTNQLETGVYNIQTKAVTSEGLISFFSQALMFGLNEVVGKAKEVDINEDGRINLIDFSIFLYNFGIPIDKKIDLNNDGRVDLIDLSIMLYWWTG